VNNNPAQAAPEVVEGVVERAEEAEGDEKAIPPICQKIMIMRKPQKVIL